MRSRLSSAATLALALTLSGCAASTDSLAPTPTTDVATVCEDASVVACDVHEQSVVVTVGATASDEDTLRLARRLHEAATASTPQPTAQLQRESVDPPRLDPEISTPPPWSITVSPGDIAAIEAALDSILPVEDVPGTLGITVHGGWPSVTVATLEQFGTVFDAVSALPLFADGGTYTLLSLDEHLRIVHTPKWVMDAVAHEVIAIAAEYPHAEVLLEAPPGGAAAPTLYIARLSPDEVAELDARLSDPRLTDAVTSGVELEYVLGSLGAEGVTYTSGVVGSRSR